jgi:hypothetical protein
MKIGEGNCASAFKLPQGIPDKLRKLLTVITQIDGEGKPSSSVDFLLAYRLSCKNRQADATPHDESRWRPKSGRLSDLSYSSSPFAARWDGGRRYTGASTTMVEGNQSKRQSSVRNAMQKTITTILQAINGYRLRVAANAAESIKQKKAPFPGAEGRGRQRNA